MEKRSAVARMRQAAAEETAGNEQRRSQLAEAQQRVAELRVGCQAEQMCSEPVWIVKHAW